MLVFLLVSIRNISGLLEMNDKKVVKFKFLLIVASFIEDMKSVCRQDWSYKHVKDLDIVDSRSNYIIM